MRGEEVSISSSVAPDLAVIGGGAIGLASAWRIAQEGMSVVVVDDAVGRGASGVAAGMLAPVTEVHYGEEALLQLNLHSSSLYPGFVAELEEASGSSAGYRRCGTLMVARDEDDKAALEEIYRFQTRLGLPVERLTSRQCRELEPALSPRVRGGVLVEGDHQVDSRALVSALVEACGRAGVVFVPERAATLLVERERVIGVSLSGGERLSCERVVLAAGAWSGSLDGIPPELRPPLRPVKGQLLHLRVPAARTAYTPPLSNRNIRGVDVYLVVRGDGRVVVGATVEEQGFDRSVTAGAVMGLLRDAFELLPAVAELELVETIAGLRPATPDNAPIIGPSSLQGLILATGHYRNGILLTPVTATAVAETVEAGTLPPGLEPFSPKRYEEKVMAAR